MYIVFVFIQDPTAIDALPVNILVASDHTVYIGVITNIVLALLGLIALDEASRRGWIGQLIFWGVNLGLLVFVIGLILDTADMKRIGAPVMGATLLLALAILAVRTWSGPTADAETELEASATPG
jgi:peptidoglycan/LPS O-acetylase OafA/YrhL